jgi:energy-converting hydrogenase A subunit R
LKRILASDCEGPLSKNDNAFELTAHFVPDGDKLFSVVSKYDDVLVDVVHKQGYNAGDTLKLILPFLKAFGVTDKKMQQFSEETLLLIAGTRQTLKHIQTLAPSFIVSTSYEPYIRALCNATGFPFENTYCTKLNLDKYKLLASEKTKLKALAREISQMEMMTIPPYARSLEDLSDQDIETVQRLDQIFWEDLAVKCCKDIFSEVKTIGGAEKAEAIRDAAAKLKVPLSGVMYVGDSITDVEAFKLVREAGGLAVSFNGNGYAVREAEVAVLSMNNVVTAVLADVFLRYGKAEALKIVDDWSPKALRSSRVDSSILAPFLAVYPDALPKVQIVTAQNLETLTKESSEFRKKVRGEAVGKLG